MLEAGGEMAGAVGGSSDGKQKNIQRKSPKNKEKYLSVKVIFYSFNVYKLSE